jgi:hypothetical protein
VPSPKKKPSALDRLTPNAITILIKGEEIVVPSNRDENTIMSMVLASQVRTLLQASIKKYKDDDTTLTPKELRDLAGAARDIATFAAEVYAAAEPISQAPKPTEAPDVTDISFESLHNTPEVQTGDPETGDSSETLPV